MQLYYALITDHKGTEVLRLKYTATAKHSAFLATKYMDSCPPAQGFKIRKIIVDASTIADIFNAERGY